MRPIKTLLLRVIAIVVALSFGLQPQEVKQGGYRTAQLKVTAGGSGWDFDTGNLIQLVLTDAKGNAESGGEYLTVGNDSPMPIKVSSKRVGIQNVEIGPGERRRFKIQGYRRPNSQYSEFNSSVPVGLVYWSGPSPQETQQTVQAKAQKDSDAKAGQERKAQEAQRAREAEEQAKKDEWTRNAQKQQDDQAARARAAAEESRRQWEIQEQRARDQQNAIAGLGQMIFKLKTDKELREQQTTIRRNLAALEGGDLVRCSSCGGSGFQSCQSCGGKGSKECSMCSGTGEYGFGAFARRCTGCGGGGNAPCDLCNGTGRDSCDRCFGKGNLGMPQMVSQSNPPLSSNLNPNRPGIDQAKSAKLIRTKPATTNKHGRAEVTLEFDGMPMTLVNVPQGSFSMGTNTLVGDKKFDELLSRSRPLHQVTLSKGFWLGKYPVTQGQWLALMGHNPSYFKNAGVDAPVEQVSWNDAQGFIARLNSMQGEWTFRLPTEAEWEFACRAGTMTDTYAGNMIIEGKRNAPVLDAIAWYAGNSGVSYSGGFDSSHWPEKQYPHTSAGTHPVGQKQPNAFGLYDMHGNVFQWCLDWLGDYGNDSVTDPQGPSSGQDKVVRGGSWYTGPFVCRSAYRSGYTSELRFNFVGFRLVAVARSH